MFRRILGFAKVCILASIVLTGVARPADAQVGLVFPIPIQKPVPKVEARQVTLFGVLATPGGTLDPQLATLQPQLGKLLPGYGFRLLGAESKRLTEGQSLTCPLGDGFSAGTTLLRPLDENGKVQLRVSVFQNQAAQLETLVHTPANQLFFCDKVFADGSRLLIGIGAR
ncbi:MAG: hypothetical protein AB7I30_16405 [Isosphaeraceae bacterium]